MAGLTIEKIEAPDQGLNTDASQATSPKRSARSLVNLLPGRPGRVVMRGPLMDPVQVFSSAVSSSWSWADTKNRVLFSDTVNGGVHKQVTLGSIPTVQTPVLASYKLAPANAAIESFVYGSGETGGTGSKIVRWFPDAAPTLVAYANGPEKFVDVINFQNRLVVLSGEPPGSATFNKYGLYWSDIGGPTADTAAVWQDDVSGLTNQKTFAGQDEPVALARIGSSLAICMSGSIWLLTGASPSAWAIRLLFSDIGVGNLSSIVEAANGFYFMSNRGTYCYTDGVSWRDVSVAIRADLKSDVTIPGTFIDAMPLNNGGIFILTPSRQYIYDTTSDGWTVFTSQTVTVQSLGKAPLYPSVYGSGYLWSARFLDAPEWSSVAIRRGRDEAFDGSFESIEASMDTRISYLGSPMTKSQLNRIIIDYVLVDGSFSESVPNHGWYVTIMDSQNSTIVAEFVTDIAPVFSAETRLRFTKDIHQECDDVYIHIEWRDNDAINLVAAEIHDVYLQYQETSQLDTIS